MTSNVQLSTMANFKAEFHEQYGEEINTCLLESHLKMSKPRANVVSFDENVSYLSTSMNLYDTELFYEQNSYRVCTRDVIKFSNPKLKSH